MSAKVFDLICSNCYLLFSATRVQLLLTETFPCCPCCGDEELKDVDSFACFYWENALGRDYGLDFFRNHYWWVPDHVSPTWREKLEAMPYRKLEKISDGPPAPLNPVVLSYCI